MVISWQRLVSTLVLLLSALAAGCTAEVSEAPEAEEEVGTAEDALWALRVSLPSHIRLYGGPTSHCLGVVGNSTANNAVVEPMPCSAPATRWVAETTYAGTSYAVVAIRNVDTNKCLDAGTAHPQQYTCHGGPAQQWRVVDNGIDLFGLHNDSRARRLRTTAGHQWFHFDPAVPSTRGLELRARSGNQWCMDVPGFAQNTIEMQAYPCNNGPNQRFQLHAWGSWPNVFELRPVHSGKCVEQMHGGNPSPVAQFFVCDGFYRQHWTLWYDLAAGDYAVVQDASYQQGITASGYDLDASTPPGRWLVR